MLYGKSIKTDPLRMAHLNASNSAITACDSKNRDTLPILAGCLPPSCQVRPRSCASKSRHRLSRACRRRDAHIVDVPRPDTVDLRVLDLEAESDPHCRVLVRRQVELLQIPARATGAGIVEERKAVAGLGPDGDPLRTIPHFDVARHERPLVAFEPAIEREDDSGVPGRRVE